MLKEIGGSLSDSWNNLLADQAVQALWIKNSDQAGREKQCRATIAALVGINPKDELEGMVAAQLIAAHNVAMECYRRAMIGDQSFEGRRESLSQANKLSRTFAALLEAPAPRQRSAKGDCRACACSRGRASRGRPHRLPRGEGRHETEGSTLCKANCPCTSAADAEPGHGAGALASRRRCGTGAAGCTAGCRRALQKVIETRSSMGATLPRRSPRAVKLRLCCVR
jgi:hypothetical protein